MTASLRNDTRGSVMVEYLIVVAFGGIVLALALARLGPNVLKSHSLQRGALYQQNP